jgi:hypothetical protein
MSNIPYKYFGLLVATLTGLLLSCESVPPASGYKPGKGSQAECLWNEEGVENPFAKPRPTSSPAALLFKIRFTDDGEFVQRCELEDALLELRSSMPRLTVVYVHGWKHNAESGDEDLHRFQGWLNDLQDHEKKQPIGDPRRRVLGIYIGWNGKTMAPGINNVTFWGRKKATDLIAHSGTVTMVISKIHSIDTQRRKNRAASADLTVYIGHSFGARILFSALSDVLINEVESQFPYETPSDNVAQPPLLPEPHVFGPIVAIGDLVVLLNPAFEASFYGPIQSLRRPYSTGPNDTSIPREIFARSQNPLMLTLSASNDRATQLAFPFGQIIGMDWEKIRRTTLGNYDDALTHSLTNYDTAPGRPEVGAGAKWWYDDFCDSRGVCLRRIRDAQSTSETGNPFIVARAPRTVIDGHNGIWSKQLKGFLIDFVHTTMINRCFPFKPYPPYEDDDHCQRQEAVR